MQTHVSNCIVELHLHAQSPEVMGNVSDDKSRTAEQLGQGRARLSPQVAKARKALFEAVHTYGIAILEGAPLKPDVVTSIADALVGAVQATPFGYKFVIKKVAEAHNLAYDSSALQQHHDVPYLKNAPDLEAFHCIRNADEGGESLFADSFAIAEKLREIDPAAFEVWASRQKRGYVET